MSIGGQLVDAYAPVKGKCTWWREVIIDEDLHDIMVKPDDKRVRCSCFVEGYYWMHPAAEVPDECPKMRHCRYYIKLS